MCAGKGRKATLMMMIANKCANLLGTFQHQHQGWQRPFVSVEDFYLYREGSSYRIVSYRIVSYLTEK